MYEIRLSILDEENIIKQLWKSGFGEDRSYYPLFRSFIYSPDNVVVLLEDKKIVSMLTIMPTIITNQKGRDFNAACFYGITTLEDYRGKGYATKIIEYALNHVFDSGYDYAFLCPATKSLFNFYEKLGFKNAFYSYEAHISANDITYAIPSDAMISSADTIGYLKARNIRLDGNLFVNWDRRQLDYAKRIAKFEGGDLSFIKLSGMTCLAATQRCKDDTVAIKELLAPHELFNTCLAIIKKRYPATNYILRCPSTYEEFEGINPRKFGMLYSNSSNNIYNGYYGFAFD